MSYSEPELYCCNEFNDFEFVLFHFDSVFNRFPSTFSKLFGSNVKIAPEKISSRKGYGRVYQNFVKSVHFPDELIIKLYSRRNHLIELFYPTQYEAILDSRLERNRTSPFADSENNGRPWWSKVLGRITTLSRLRIPNTKYPPSVFANALTSFAENLGNGALAK